jgi:magnesium transporter
VVFITEINLFLGNTFLVTVSREETDKILPMEKILQNMRRYREQNLQGPAFLMHSILDHLVDQKFATIETIEDEIVGLEDAMIAAPVHFSPQELQLTKRNLMAMRKSVMHEREILLKLCRKDSRYIPENSIFFYSDILDHLIKFYETIETNRDIVTSLIQMNLSSTSNAMAEAANRTNKSVSRLTMISTICMPLTLIAGIGGMSEWTMMTGTDNWHIAYPLLMLGMTGAAIITYFLLKWYNTKK